MTPAMQARISRLAPNGIPKYIHAYDNGGETADRYTVVFTGRYTHKTGGAHWYIGASASPFHPQGIGQTGESDRPIDYPSYGHIGKKIGFNALPPDVKKFVWQIYADLWDIPKPTAPAGMAAGMGGGTIETDTAIVPDIVADTVVGEVERVVGKPLPKRLSLVASLVVHAENVYRSNADFAKRIRAKGNRGRDMLYVFMRHWLASELRTSPWNTRAWKLKEHHFRLLANGQSPITGKT